MVADYERVLLATLKEEVQLSAGARLLVGVSGGCDSMALLAALDAIAKSHDFPLLLAVAHVDHGIRGRAGEQDAAVVEKRTGQFGLPFFSVRLELGASRENLEERAREARLAALRGIAGAWRASWIVLGHTRDDQAETFLMRLARGGGVGALSGMEIARSDRILRPLLNVPREAGRTYLRERGLSWVEDETNRDFRFFRNRVRHQVIPALQEGLGVDIADRLSRLATELRVESALAERALAAKLPSPAEPVLEVALVKSMGDAAARLLHGWLAGLGIRATERQVVQLAEIARSGRPSGELALPGGRRVRRRYGSLCLLEAKEVVRLESISRGWEDVPVAIPGRGSLPNGMRIIAQLGGDSPLPRRTDRFAVAFAADAVAEGLVARPPREGDRITLPGGRRRLSDLFIDRRVPRDLRRALTVVANRDDILWVPGVAACRRARTSGGSEVVVLTAQGSLLESLGAC